MSGPHVLVIDDDVEVCELLAKVLTRGGYRVTCEHTGEAGLAHLTATPGTVDCLVVDKRLPGMNGAEVVAAAKRTIPGLPVVLMTAHPEPFSLGDERPDVCLAKPFRSLEAIEEAVTMALETSTTETALEGLKHTFTQVVAEIAPLRKKRE